jgi:dipeptidyl aminopeptidase/acylaminoacyl peptidase
MTDVGGPWCDGRTMSEDLQLPPFLRPFVLPYQPVEPLHVGDLDLYLPQATPAPAVLMIHGGPIRPDMPARPRQWSAYRGYASLLAQAGLVGAMFEHGFVDDQTLGVARDDIRRALAALRDDSRVDADRVGLWFFSAGGLLMGSFLDPPPPGVVAVAGTYAAPADPDLDGTDLRQAIDTAPNSTVPLMVVRPQHDFDWIAPATDELLERCRATGRAVDVIDVPGGHHGFETVDDTDDSRDAVRRSIAWWADALP